MSFLASIGVQSVEPGLMEGAIFQVWKEAGSPSIIPRDLQQITKVTEVDPKSTSRSSPPPSAPLPLHKQTTIFTLPKRQTALPIDDAITKKYKRRPPQSRSSKTQTVAVAQKTKVLKRRTVQVQTKTSPVTHTRPVTRSITRSQSTATS